MFKSATITEQDARFRQSLKVVPVKNEKAVIVPTPRPGEIELEVTLVYKGPVLNFLRTLLKAHDKKRYILDTIGKRVYEAVDGKKTFEQIIDEFAAREKLTFFETRALLGQYFQTLTRRGIIIPTLPRHNP